MPATSRGRRTDGSHDLRSPPLRRETVHGIHIADLRGKKKGSDHAVLRVLVVTGRKHVAAIAWPALDSSVST